MSSTSSVAKLRSRLRLRSRIKQLPEWFASLRKAEAQDREMLIRPGQQKTGGILIVSHAEKQCGIHEYGLNIAAALEKSSRYSFAYAECSNEKELRRAVKQIKPSAIIYNYYPATMPWLTSQMVRRYKVASLGIMHEVTQEEADRATREMFDYHLGPDPTLVENNPILFKTRRLIPTYHSRPPVPDVVTIGSFGFGFGGKGFEHLIETVHREFDEARIALHLPFNGVVSSQLQERAMASIKKSAERISKPGIKLVITRDFLSKSQLLDFLASNTLNAFFYDTGKHLGISSAIEHALAVRRPMAITKCGMFRHVFSAYPSICIEDSSLSRIIENGVTPLEPFYEEWSEANFILDYERILDEVFERESKTTSARKVRLALT
ncbi:MAG: hypothetical protein WAQ99_17925 [Pyrinomonadaceae bacterium]